ncbi:ApbE superfamily uncharacterized protein (UPF0280 family) [Variovorax boronicumulans]|uniref:ApbE superfamily uncharacterized protein (UPF0280 family) n=1 Tax=Variovorax boronicumulans TaxID=436515 RepID=A0AAW8D8I9_9BURK|nr:UPF0280 family protein [Variovorax boronicumulans]MDP9897495.1 ApbE superfamily uncharacterized protein (UPF0280 family) [Variovorax boronicumulans]MDQ0057534.1 ApbE superfamily uncharacterized protein (UPF0280 family) [Variovorax boronicumulans]
MSAQRSALDSSRWHFNHGPIDIVAEAHGDPYAVAAAHDAAWARFGHVLDELVRELPLLRLPVTDKLRPRGVVGQRMWDACAAFSPMFITPMAAVAGSVAQELIAFYDRPGIERAWINNGGDIAVHLAPGHSARVGVFADIARFDWRNHSNSILTTDGQFELHADEPVRGVATSGWRGRSFSLGIADSVTVLAATAAQADAAATVIANAVDVDDALIQRKPASECKDDSDLGDALVTVDVPPLAPSQVKSALDTGAICAKVLQKGGLVWAALLVCQGQFRLVEPLCSKSLQTVLPKSLGSVFA